MAVEGRLARTIRIAGYLAILFGLFGALSGAAGAGTLIPYRNASTFNSQSAEALTAIAAAAAILSLAGIVAGWQLLRARAWAWNWTVGTALGCVASVAALTVLWPQSWGFLLVVALAYALEIGLLYSGRAEYRALARAAPA